MKRALKQIYKFFKNKIFHKTEFFFLRYKYKKNFKNVEIEENLFTVVLKWYRVLQVNPRHSEAISSIINIFIEINRVDISKEILSSYSKILDEKLFLALNARVSTKLEDTNSAIKYWKLLFNEESKIEYYNATLQLSNIYLKLENKELFLKYSEYVKIFHSDKYQYEQLMSRFYYNRKDWEQCINYCKLLITNKISLSSSLDRLIKAKLNSNYPKEALIIIEEENSFNYFPKLKSYLLGRCYYNQYNYALAIENFLQALKVNPSFNEGVIWLTKAYYANKEFDKAEKLYYQYKNLNDKVFAGVLAESAGLLSLAENEYSESIGNIQLINFYIKHRYWGKAYQVILDKESENLNILSKKIMIENLSSTLNYDIKEKYKQHEVLEDFMSTELIIDSLVLRINSLAIVKKKIKPLEKIALVLGSLGPGGAERQCTVLYNLLQKEVELQNIKEVKLFVTNISRTKRDSFYIKDINNTKFIIEYLNRNEIIDVYTISELEQYADLIEHIQPVSRQQSIIQLVYHLNKFQPDVVHGWLDETIINSFLAASILSVPAIVGRWGSMPPGNGRTHTEIQMHNVKYLDSAYKSIAKLKNIQFTSNTEVTGNAYANWINIESSQVKTIYNGLNFESLKITKDKELLKKELDIPKNIKIVGSINRISEEKQPFLWVDIAQKVINDYKEEIYFILVGEGPLMIQVEKYIEKLDMKKNIILCGNQTDVANWYNIMDIFILTSKVEGLSNSMLEAQFLGKPVIIPNVGGLKEGIIQNKTGILLTKSVEVEEFSLNIIELLNNGWDEKEREFNKNYIFTTFSPNLMLERTLDIYINILGKTNDT